MNNSSSWSCFSWNRGQKDQGDGIRRPAGSHHERGTSDHAEIPDEQFANLLGGE